MAAKPFSELRSQISPEAQLRARVKTRSMLAAMNGAPHPGEVLADYLGGLSLDAAAAKIGMGREHLSRLLDRQTSIDVKMAVKLAKTFGTSEDYWLELQSAYEFAAR